MLRYATRLSRQLRGSIEVRLRNAELVEELRAQKKAAEEANVAKSRFLAVASHDLRQPLHAPCAFVQALEDTSLPGHAQQLVANVRRSVNSMEELFDSLLDISRLEAGVVHARVEVIPLAELLERLSFEYGTVAQRKGLSLQVMQTSLYVCSDPTLLLARILRSNLVANAVRYTERGRVLVGCRRRGSEVSIEVWDTGPGIASGKHAEVFQEFTQLGEPERDRRARGLGLGLAIVDRLAKLLGHTVHLRSVVGKGSVFAINAPRGRLEAEAILQAAQVTTHFDLRGRLALVVQGEADHGQLALEQLLRGWQCEVIAAGAGEVRELLGGLRRLPDFIIVTQPAGGESGAALVEMLRNEFNAEVPALLVGSGPAPLATETDALPVLNRPFNAARLRTLINNLLQAPVARARRVG